MSKKIREVVIKLTGRELLDRGAPGLAVFCKKYTGKGFTTQKLQDAADLGLWWCRIQGNPFNCEGEGSSPTCAIRDSISRNKDLIKKLEQANVALTAALEIEGWDDEDLETQVCDKRGGADSPTPGGK